MNFSGAAIKRVQRGVIVFAASDASKTATLTNSVDTTKAGVTHLGVNFLGTPSAGESNVMLQLTNGTTVTASRSNSGSTAISVSYEVYEFL